ncbi:hypothetical protein PFISCL1PPCAC_5489, partial [Pristionchus fissidentatus]
HLSSSPLPFPFFSPSLSSLVLTNHEQFLSSFDSHFQFDQIRSFVASLSSFLHRFFSFDPFLAVCPS